MKYFAFLILLLFSIASCNSFEDKLKCILENEKVRKSIINVLKSILAKEQPIFIVSKVYIAITEIKKRYEVCSKEEEEEPVLKGGCRYEEQFKNCQLNSCEYMDEYECYEYCARKYC